jgi:hypothetical protein
MFHVEGGISWYVLCRFRLLLSSLVRFVATYVDLNVNVLPTVEHDSVKPQFMQDIKDNAKKL